jgi:tetratricopeptide (TPR) repeat protein
MGCIFRLSEMTPTTKLGHYRLDEPIGAGAMGEVFRATDTRLNRSVAIKVISSARRELGPSIQRFLREARAASALNHPNIVTIHEVGETPTGDHFIVQELIDGCTLRAALESDLPMTRAVEIGRQVARAMTAAHAAGIVHRDLKPENIMIRSDGYVKVLDFGLARVVGDGASEDSTKAHMHTTPGTLIGTTPYMSPELARGEVAGPPSDMFALGILLYEMVAGRRPFQAPTHLGVIAAILSEQPVSLSRLDATVPRPLDTLVQRMLAKEPARRPSAREVGDELATILHGATAPAVGTLAVPEQHRATVGRDKERAELRRAYARVKEGRSLLLAVSGEPGLGKTSLVEDFLAELATSPERPIVTRGRCSERLAGAEAYLPIFEALDNLLERTSGESINSVMKAVAPNWYVQVASPTLAQSALERVRDSGPAVSQERLKRELGALFQELSRMRTVVVFLDDLHWADVSTVDVLNYVATRLGDMRLLVLTTFRPAEMALAQHPFLSIRNDLRARGAFEQLDLQFLQPADVGRYLAQEFPAHRFPDDLAAMIHAKTDGSPLFMADLVRYLRDSGGIAEEHGTWVLKRSLSDAPTDLPSSVRSMIARKMDQLDESDRKLLLVASVQGHEFDTAIVSEAAELEAAHVEERLEILEQVHVFVRRGHEHEFPDLTLTLKYQFVHVLYQNMLYASLQPTRRAALSGRVARALVARHATQAANIAGRLGVLFEAARDFSGSAQHFLVAAQHGVGLFAFREALSLADRGLNALRGLPEGSARRQRELGLQMIKGRALRSIKGWAAPELQDIFARASQLCHELDDPPELFPVLCSIAHYHMIRGNLGECRDQADALVTQATRAGNPAYLMAASHLAGVSREFLGEMVEASYHLERARDLHVPSEHSAYTAMYGLDPGMLARAMTSRPLWALGYPDRAEERARETVTLARSQRQPTTLAFALVVMQGIHLYRGEAGAAAAMGTEIVTLCGEYELKQELAWSRCFQGAAHAALGHTHEGIAELQESLAAQQAMSAWLVRPAFLALLAEALLAADRIDEGLAAIDEGFACAERASEGGYISELHRIRAALRCRLGQQAEAEQSLRAALDYAAQQHTRSFELRAATALARLYLAQGRAPDGRGVLAPVYHWFTEGHTTADLIAARTTLSEME